MLYIILVQFEVSRKFVILQWVHGLMNTGLSGYFSSTQFSSHFSKTVSICLYKLSEQSHLSNVAEQRHTNTGKFPGSTCPSQQGHCFQLTKPMTPFSLSQNRAIGHHQTFSSNAVHLISSNGSHFLKENLERRLVVMVHQVSCSSVQATSSCALPSCLPQFPHSTTGCTLVFVQPEASRVPCCSKGATCGSESICGRPRKTGELSWITAEALRSRRLAINLIYWHSATL